MSEPDPTFNQLPPDHKARCPNCFAPVVIKPIGHYLVIRDETGAVKCGECGKFFAVPEKQ